MAVLISYVLFSMPTVTKFLCKLLLSLQFPPKAHKGSRPVRKVQFFFNIGGVGQTHVQKLCCKFGVFWRSFNNMKFA